MSLDIGSILRDWPYEPGQISARRVTGADGREKIQLRLELGLLQMEVTGRPDGQRPEGQESLLAYYEGQLRQHKEKTGSDDGFELDEKACELLRTEGTMYYHRYLACFVLEDYPGVIRDTGRNLRLMEFCKKYAHEESDRYVLEQYRPYVVMMSARAKGRLSLRDNKPREAMEIVRRGIKDIEDFYRSFGQEDLISGSGEIAILQAMVKEIEARIPVDPIRKLRQKLAEAVRQERYEEAAALRDQLRKVTDRPEGNL